MRGVQLEISVKKKPDPVPQVVELVSAHKTLILLYPPPVGDIVVFVLKQKLMVTPVTDGLIAGRLLHTAQYSAFFFFDKN